MCVNSCNWPLPSHLVGHWGFQRGFGCSISLDVHYMDSRLSVRGQLHPPVYVFLGSNLHVCKRRQNSGIFVVFPEYPTEINLFLDIEMGGNDFIVLAILCLLPQLSRVLFLFHVEHAFHKVLQQAFSRIVFQFCIF